MGKHQRLKEDNWAADADQLECLMFYAWDRMEKAGIKITQKNTVVYLTEAGLMPTNTACCHVDTNGNRCNYKAFITGYCRTHELSEERRQAVSYLQNLLANNSHRLKNILLDKPQDIVSNL